MTALILVDLQNDFFPGGALAVQEADKILPTLNTLLSLPFDLIVATKDWHPRNHVSFASAGKPGWPEHCIQNTKGAAFVPGWSVDKVAEIIHKGTNPLIDSYSTFFDNNHTHSTGLDALLKDKGIHTIYLAGLATEYCVKYSALDAQKLGFKVVVIKEGCRGVKEEDSSQAFSEMKQAGVTIIDNLESLDS